MRGDIWKQVGDQLKGIIESAFFLFLLFFFNFFNYLHWQRGTECQNYKAEVAQGLRIKTALLETCLKSKHFLGHV